MLSSASVLLFANPIQDNLLRVSSETNGATRIQTVNLPRLNEMAPNCEAKTTEGMVQPADYCNRWLVLFSH